MKELIPTTQDENGNILVSGRDLHEFLESGERYSKWFEARKSAEWVHGNYLKLDWEAKL